MPQPQYTLSWMLSLVRASFQGDLIYRHLFETWLECGNHCAEITRTGIPMRCYALIADRGWDRVRQNES